jgi:hypothetical protein
MLRAGISTRTCRMSLAVAALMVGGASLVLAVQHGIRLEIRLLLLAIGIGFPQVNFSLNTMTLAELAPPSQRTVATTILVALTTTAGLIAPLFIGLILSGMHDRSAAYRDAFTYLGLQSMAAGLAAHWLFHAGKPAQSMNSATDSG